MCQSDQTFFYQKLLIFYVCNTAYKRIPSCALVQDFIDSSGPVPMALRLVYCAYEGQSDRFVNGDNIGSADRPPFENSCHVTQLADIPLARRLGRIAHRTADVEPLQRRLRRSTPYQPRIKGLKTCILT